MESVKDPIPKCQRLQIFSLHQDSSRNGEEGAKGLTFIECLYTLVIVQIRLLTLSFGLVIVHMFKMTGSGKFSTLFKVTWYYETEPCPRSCLPKRLSSSPFIIMVDISAHISHVLLFTSWLLP